MVFPAFISLICLANLPWSKAVLDITTTASTVQDVTGSAVLSSMASSSLARATKWLLNQRRHTGKWSRLEEGWGEETPRAVLALQLTNASWIATDPAGALALKQVEVNLLEKLCTSSSNKQNSKGGVSPGSLALHTMAWQSACLEARDFHGHDLIGTLQHSQPRHGFEAALISLAVCSTGNQPRKRHIRSLLDMTQLVKDRNSENYIDTTAMAILALQCINSHPKSHDLSRYLKVPIATLVEKSHEGSLHNLFKVSLVVQALASVGEHVAASRFLAYLLGHQKADGSFGSVFATSEAILALDVLRGGEGLSALPKRREWNSCDLYSKDTEPAALLDAFIALPEESTITPSEEVATVLSSPKSMQQQRVDLADEQLESSNKINFSFWLWIGNKPNETRVHLLNLTVPVNTTFYTAMQKASHLSQEYEFASSLWPNGHYIHTLNGRKEDPSAFQFWLLYVLRDPPDVNYPPSTEHVAPTGVDELVVEEGQHYLYWFKVI